MPAVTSIRPVLCNKNKETTLSIVCCKLGEFTVRVETVLVQLQRSFLSVSPPQDADRKPATSAVSFPHPSLSRMTVVRLTAVIGASV